MIEANKHMLPSLEKSLLSEFSGNVPGAVFYYSLFPDGAIALAFLNDHCEQIWGHSVADVETTPDKIWEMTHSDDVVQLRASILTSAQDLTLWDQTWRWIDPNGVQKWLHGRGMPHQMADGSVRWMTFVFDITARILSEARAETAQEQLFVAMQAIPDGFAIFDKTERLFACNDKFKELYQELEGSLLIGALYKDILWAGVEVGLFCTQGENAATWVDAQLIRYRGADGVQEMALRDGRWVRVLERATSDGGRIVFHIEITAAKKRQKELEKAALTDTLTGVLNRRGLAEKCADFAEGERLAILHIDLDRFKTINDAMGHEAGDHVLTEVSRALLAHTDPRAAVARVGGDEFVVVLPTTLASEQVIRITEKLRENVTKSTRFEGRICQIGATIGVSFLNENSTETFEQALLDADTALIQGKGFGRNRTILFQPQMRNQAVEAAHVASQIKDGLCQGQFIAYFQPQIEWPSGRLCGLEALARWRKPDGTVLPANSFISIANETGQIVDIDDQILIHGLQALGEADLKQTRMSFNFSGAQLSAPNLVEKITRIINQHDISYAQVTIEVLESTLLDHRSNTVAENIHALADAGFRIELDDFGTGHTALASLRQFPVHGIKIDRSLIRSIDTDPSLLAITDGIFNLCERLKIDVIAEGVETEAELSTLTKMGLTVFQGYLFAKPMPFVALCAMLSENGGSDTHLGTRQPET